MKWLMDILRGMVIGIANIIPGVSGGTMAVSLGIYDTLIGAVSGIFKHFKKSILILLPLGVGMGIGIVGFGYGLEYLLNRWTLATCLVFVGLVLGGVPILYTRFRQKIAQKPSKKIGVAEILCLVLLLAFGVGMSLLQGSAERTLTFGVGSMVLLFVLGVVASATMVIPGVSGSMVLLVLGYYDSILGLITGSVDALTGGDWQTLMHNVGMLIPFGIGVLLGIFGIAKLIEYLFAHFPSQTYAAILGLILSSPFAILYSSGAFGMFSWGGLVVGLVLGVAAAFITLRMGQAEDA